LRLALDLLLQDPTLRLALRASFIQAGQALLHVLALSPLMREPLELLRQRRDLLLERSEGRALAGLASPRRGEGRVDLGLCRFEHALEDRVLRERLQCFVQPFTPRAIAIGLQASLQD